MKKWITLLSCLVIIKSAAQISTFPYEENFDAFNMCSTSCTDSCILVND